MKTFIRETNGDDIHVCDVSVSLFVVLLSCQYHCLWCYYHVTIIVCDVIIMSVLLIDFSSSFSFFSFLFAIPHSMYITQTIYFVWYRASLGQVTGTERVTHIAFMSLKVNASRVDDVMGNLEGVMQARCVTLVKTRWRHFLSMPRVYFNAPPLVNDTGNLGSLRLYKAS